MNSRFMIFNFKLVYTSIVYTIQIDSIENLQTLFYLARNKFKDHINYDLFNIDFVISGQERREMAAAVNNDALGEMLEDLFGDNYKHISFYVRPIPKNREVFMRLDTYLIPELPGTEEQQQEQQISEHPDEEGIEQPVQEQQSSRYTPPPPPGLRRADYTVFV